ncbi:Uncharacterised protein [Mycobacteroides abscessus subsp. massiliense]|nr:Uncharacterised protein [Mycobacteroides abscessus subsp. massiliense]
MPSKPPPSLSATSLACCWPVAVRWGPGTEVSIFPDALPSDSPCRTKVMVIGSAAQATTAVTIEKTRAAITVVRTRDIARVFDSRIKNPHP